MSVHCRAWVVRETGNIMVDQGHDYGYDMAHEMRAIAAMPQQRRGTSRPLTAGTGAPHDLDPDTDFGHDQAHEA